MKKPYLKLYRKIGPYTSWIVDGEWIREHVDIDFTNFAYHYAQKYVPDKQFWLDVDLGVKEYQFYLDNLIARYFAVKDDGMDTEEARAVGDKVEKKERSKANPHFKDIDSSNIDKKPVGKIGSVRVFVVPGDQVRALDDDYWGGGHDLVYPYVKPKNSIWLDDSQLPKSYRKLLVHEFYERSIMAFGMSYEDAHYRASIVELYCRIYPKVTKTILEYLQSHEKDKDALLRLPKLLRFEKSH